MKKILIVSYYDLKEYLLNIKNLLQDFNYEVTYYPLFQYAYDTNDKIDNYKEHFNNHIEKHRIDIILWWFLDVPLDVFRFIKQKKSGSLFYNVQ